MADKEWGLFAGLFKRHDKKSVKERDKVWDLFVELRKELVEAQKIRSQILGFKFTFISGLTALLFANKIDNQLLVLPAFSAIFFDFIIYSYSFSIKRIGCYTREHIEPALTASESLPENFPMWQEYLLQDKTKQKLSMYGNFGVTILTIVMGLIALVYYFDSLISPVLMIALLLFTMMDYMAYRMPERLNPVVQ